MVNTTCMCIYDCYKSLYAFCSFSIAFFTADILAVFQIAYFVFLHLLHTAAASTKYILVHLYFL